MKTILVCEDDDNVNGGDDDDGDVNGGDVDDDDVNGDDDDDDDDDVPFRMLMVILLLY